MSPKQRMHAALSDEGADHIPCVIPYEQLFIRDHWKELTSCPWWFQFESDLDRQMQWNEEAVRGLGHDWFSLRTVEPLSDRRDARIDVRAEGVYRSNSITGESLRLREPLVSGQDEK